MVFTLTSCPNSGPATFNCPTLQGVQHCKTISSCVRHVVSNLTTDFYVLLYVTRFMIAQPVK
jgi:hypothetical protein